MPVLRGKFAIELDGCQYEITNLARDCYVLTVWHGGKSLSE
jgi:hypothetical protein